MKKFFPVTVSIMLFLSFALPLNAQVSGVSTAMVATVIAADEKADGSLTGFVTDGIVPISGALVTLAPGGYQDTTNLVGYYSISGIPEGTYTITVTASGYASWGTSKIIAAGTNSQNVDLTAVTGSLSGIVGSGATPVSGATVVLNPGGYTATTGALGTYSIDNLTPGDYTVTVTATGYETWTGNKTVATGTNIQNVDLTPIVETGSLTGVVRSGATPVSGATVTLTPGGYTATSIIGGGFSISDIPVGDYTITVTATGYLEWTLPKTIVSGTNLQDVELTPIVETGSLTGVVRSGATPVSGATVTLNPGGYTATSIIGGGFSISDIPVGDYTITVTATGYLQWTLPKTIVSGANLQDVELTPIVETGSLTGVVRSGATLVSGATVTLTPGGYTATSIVGGGFSISDIPVGDYTITVTATGYVDWTLPKTIVSGANLQDVELTPIVETGSLTGVVRSGATLVSGATVTLTPGGYTATSIVGGGFTIGDIPVGDYTITVTAVGYVDWTLPKTIVSGTNLQDVELTPVVVIGSLSGEVRSGISTITGAVITLTPGDYTATSAMYGLFTITDIPGGDYTITAQAAGYQPWSSTITIVNGANLRDVELAPLTGTGSLSGVVRSGITLIPGALVTLIPGDYTSTTGASGEFSLSDIPVGYYTLSVTAAGYEEWTGSVTIAVGINTQDANLTAPVNEGEGEIVPEGEGEVLPEGEGELLPEGEGEVLPEGEGEVLPEGEGEVLPEGEGEVLPEGEGEVLPEGEGEVLPEGEGEVLPEGEGEILPEGEGEVLPEGEGEILPEGEGEVLPEGEGEVLPEGEGEGLPEGEGEVLPEGEGEGLPEGEGEVLPEGEGEVLPEGEGEGLPEGEGEILPEGEGEVLPEGEGEILPEGEGEVLPEGEGEVLPEGEGEVLPEGEGEVLPEGEGEALPEGEGEVLPEGEGEVLPEGEGEILPEGEGEVLPEGEGEVLPEGEGELLPEGEGEVLPEGEGEILPEGEGEVLPEGEGEVLPEGEGEVMPEGEGEIVAEGEGEVLPEGEGEVLPEGEGEVLPEGEGEVLPEGEGEIVAEGEGEVLPEGEGEDQACGCCRATGKTLSPRELFERTLGDWLLIGVSLLALTVLAGTRR